MQVAISLLNFRPGRIGGAETYIRQLVRALALAKGEDTITLVLRKDCADEFPWQGIEQVVMDASDREIIAARLLEAFTPYRARVAERVFSHVAPDVVLFPQQSIFPKRLPYPAVLTVHDVQHLIFPQHFPRSERAFRWAIYPFSLQRADRVLAISEFTRRTLLSRCHLSPDKVRAVPSGFDPRPLSTGKRPIRNPYLYYPAATFPHKNHRGLFETIAALRRDGRFEFELVLSGMQTPHWRELRRQIEKLGLSDIVDHVGFVPFEIVCSLYHGAEAVVFPTLYEGFGLPILEAVSYGKKVVVSRLEVFQELGVPDRFCIDFSDPDQFRQALDQPGPTVLTKTPLTWADCARETLRVLREAAAPPATDSSAVVQHASRVS